jgi:putative heme-binding domain-containing protein
MVSRDSVWRIAYDKTPPPPPHPEGSPFRGRDLNTVHEDGDQDGSFELHKVFLDGLSLATSVAFGDGGVWVLQPPYLLFYPDADGDDVPDRDPEVHLAGFHLEDSHSVANSLCLGPDGWLYAAQGSTVSADVLRPGIDGVDAARHSMGQLIWRYHPRTRQYEVFAEGGGNTFGVAFDDVGRVYSGTNWGKYRGLHYVQGGYYVKGWGKHGPLTNPYALGFFDHMPHVGNADRLVHTFTVYGGDALPGLQGKIVGVNALQRRLQVTRFEKLRSTLKTVEEPFLLTTSDERFRPVDVKPGPDGALYVADLYEPRINHVDPRDNWDRATGRIYRIRPKDYRPVAPFDLAKKSSKELVALLGHSNRWYRETARRLLADRKDWGAIPYLLLNLGSDEGQLALESLWALHVVGGLTEGALDRAFVHVNPHVRRWAVRLVGDEGKVTSGVERELLSLAEKEKDAEVCSQLASTAKRLPGPLGLRLALALLRRDEFVDDPHIPLLIWWAIEAHAETQREQILQAFDAKQTWQSALAQRYVLERLMQRWTMSGTRRNLVACARLLDKARDARHVQRLLAGLEKGFEGRSAADVPITLSEAVFAAWKRTDTTSSLTLGLRLGHRPAVAKALKLVADEKADRALRLACLRILGEVYEVDCVPVLLDVVRKSPSGPARREALGALGRYGDEKVGKAVLALYLAGLPEADGVRGGAVNLLTSRPAWARLFLTAVDAGKVNPRAVPTEAVQKLALFKDEDIAKRVTKHWGRVRGSTPQQKQREIVRVAKILKGGKGDAKAGQKVYADTCGKCHKLFGAGGDVGPELTGYERTNAMYWMENIIDPSAVIREEYMTFVVRTDDGRTLSGVVAGQDKTTVTLRDQEARTTRLERARIEDMRASPVSLMPEDQLRTLSDQQVRDLFAYLMKK